MTRLHGSPLAEATRRTPHGAASVPGMTLGDVGTLVGAGIALGALLVAFLARRDSMASSRASAASAESSERAAAAAEQSLELSHLESMRRVERTDVEWRAEGGNGQCHSVVATLLALGAVWEALGCGVVGCCRWRIG